MRLEENISAKRRERKMSQDYVAEQLGVSRQAVSKWETGKSVPNMSNLTQLAALFEISLSELAEPQECMGEQDKRDKGKEEKRKNAKMLVLRWMAYILITLGYSGYCGFYSGALNYYWLAIIGAGLVLLFITSRDYFRKAKLCTLQCALGAVLLFSIFVLPHLIPLGLGLNVLISHAAAFSMVAVLNLRYWRLVWKCK